MSTMTLIICEYWSTMQPQIVATNDALGGIARHHISDGHGRRLVSKGRVIQASDVEALLDAGIVEVAIVRLAPDDVDEHAAAAFVATQAAGVGTGAHAPHHGRADIVAQQAGVVVVDEMRLGAWHQRSGVTIATLRSYGAVAAHQRIATVKILPFALPRHLLTDTPGAVISVHPFRVHQVGVLVIGSSPQVCQRLRHSHLPALDARLRALGAAPTVVVDVAFVEGEVAAQIRQLVTQCQLVISVSETSIMDGDDVIPRALRLAGGEVTCYGAPVEPGNLLLLGHVAAVPFVGAPGCVRSAHRNVVDLVLPRIMAGFWPTAAEIYALGHGGLLE
jgi:molybdenum cofactor cytidylyltransferase